MATSRYKCNYCLNIYIKDDDNILTIYYDETPYGCDYCDEWRSGLVIDTIGEIGYIRQLPIEVEFNGRT
jgi:hypothetical protein